MAFVNTKVSTHCIVTMKHLYLETSHIYNIFCNISELCNVVDVLLDCCYVNTYCHMEIDYVDHKIIKSYKMAYTVVLGHYSYMHFPLSIVFFEPYTVDPWLSNHLCTSRFQNVRITELFG